MERYTQEQLVALIGSVGTAIKREFAPHQTLDLNTADELVDKVVDQHIISIEDDNEKRKPLLQSKD